MDNSCTKFVMPLILTFLFATELCTIINHIRCKIEASEKENLGGLSQTSSVLSWDNV